MIDAKTFLKLPIRFKDICSVYPPSVNDVVSNMQILSAYQMLTMTKDDVEDYIKEHHPDAKVEKFPTPWEFVMTNMEYNSEFAKTITDFIQLMTHISITPIYKNQIWIFSDLKDISAINSIADIPYISKDNFFDFQNTLRLAFGSKTIDPQDEEISSNPFIAKVQAAARRREKAAAKNKCKGGISFTASLCSICCMGIGLTPLNIGEISYASVKELINMYQQKEKYDIDIKSLMAGADPKKVKPKYWIREENDFQEIQI